MRSHKIVASAARVARTFKMDPVEVLDSEPFEWLLRIACYEVVADDAEKASRESERKNKR